MTKTLFMERRIAVMQLKQGKTIREVAQILNRSVGWVSKWKGRYEKEGLIGLKDHSRAPKVHGRKLSPVVSKIICETRIELEAEALLGKGLKYIGSQAIKTRLKQKGVNPLPSIPTIERVISRANLTKASEKENPQMISYPRLHPMKPHQLVQVDIVPHFLYGGQRVACFNALDVVSKYPTGQAFHQRRSVDAAQFLVHVWQELGIPNYTQVDNEGCFSGGATHKHVLGKVVRLALQIGTELVFSPCYHPQSNGFIERFHQDYNYHVWQDTYLENLAIVNKQAIFFFSLYRQREEHKALNGQSPATVHFRQTPQKLDATFILPSEKMPLHEGRIHFMRRVNSDSRVSVLNDGWYVPSPDPQKGVWVTLELLASGAELSIFDLPPDDSQRVCLATYPFPLKESVLSSQAI